MAVLEAFILGIVQGLTEFLPISSSAHLVFGRALMPGFGVPGILFEVLVHTGTLAAVIYFFRRELVEMVRSLLPGGDPASRRVILFIIMASIPTGIAGLALKHQVEILFTSPAAAAAMLLVTGLLLWFSETLAKPRVNMADMGYLRAFGVGLFQSVALLPGISRSGATISGGRLLGLVGEDAARFSFLISIPAVLGATLLELRSVETLAGENLKLCLVGVGAAFLAGLASLGLLMAIVRKSKLRWFAAYCWVVGITILALGV